MFLFKRVKDLQQHLEMVRSRGEIIGFVPTMGALHEGHLSLCKLAQQKADKVLVSIYVNPTQFDKNEDLGNYPKQIKQDIQKLLDQGVDAIFLPKTSDIYPENFTNYIKANSDLKGILCDVNRPTHFNGVVTVVNRLFNLIQPSLAVFGEKDFQQLAIIKDMAKNLLPNIKIIGSKIIRETDGLAMSSRNQYLSKQQRLIAGKINKRLDDFLNLNITGIVSPALDKYKKLLLKDGFGEVQYLEIRTQDKLELVQELPTKTSCRIFCAVKIANTRLIDNKILA